MMTNPRWQQFGTLLVVATLSALALACQSATNSGADSTATPNRPTEEPTTVAETPISSPILAPADPGPPPSDFVGDFDPHTVSDIESVDEFFALARVGHNDRRIVKFTVVDFFGGAESVWYDSNFYRLHDEWYWFMLLGNQTINGVPEAPVDDVTFATIREIYDWAEALSARDDPLPLDLKFYRDKRLASLNFYTLSGTDSNDVKLNRLGFERRHFGLGSIVYLPPTQSRAEQWLLELEFQDPADAADVERYLEVTTAGLPAVIAEKLMWVPRSPDQIIVAEQMESQSLPYGDRIAYYEDLIEPGIVEVYNSGITAGLLTRITDDPDDPIGTTLRETTSESIILTEFVPDWLPPAAGLITQNPQTPLAHVNLLAANRGIPNASQSGLLSDLAIESLARVKAPAIVLATEDGQLDIIAITSDEYDEYRDLLAKPAISVPAVDLSRAAYTIDLTLAAREVTSATQLEALQRIIGGKAAGFLGLLAPGSVVTPEHPLAITVRAYAEHLANLDRELTAMLGNSDFSKSERARVMLLEGIEEYDTIYEGDPAAEQYKADFLDTYPPSSDIGQLVELGGFKELIRATPIDPATLEFITAAVTTTFGDHSDMQGLRFRSSSSVEDIEGFNGAGLYDSNTGFLQPELQSSDKDQKKSIEWAIKKTWASYWGFEAFEERRQENIDHRSGGMGVVVHARFDDDLERSNGVFTITLLPANNPDSDRYVLELNVQDGFESVTNPRPSLGALPEVSIVRRGAGSSDPISIERVSASNLYTDDGEGPWILSDGELELIFEQAVDVADAWLTLRNAERDPAQRSETIILDFEFREMAAGWPAVVDGVTPHRQRIVIKQARSLDPGTRGVPAEVRDLPIPDDLEARARRVEIVECGDGQELQFRVVEVFTDPLGGLDMGYSVEPFIAAIAVGDGGLFSINRDWTEFTVEADGDPARAELVLNEPVDDFERMVFDTEPGRSSLTISGPEGTPERSGDVVCQRSAILTTAEDFLYDVLASRPAGS